MAHMDTRLQSSYKNEVAPALKESFGYANLHNIPRVAKVVINVGLGEATQNAKIVDVVDAELQRITGQKPMICRAKVSVSNFKLREGMPIGLKVTLRGKRMYEFLDRLINIALPRVRDFRGIEPNAFDGRGTYNLGIKEHNIFPEIDTDRMDKLRGMNISIVTTASTDDEARELLRHFGMPFRK